MTSIKTVENWSELPGAGMQIYPIDDVIEANEHFAKYEPFGYNNAILCTGTRTLHIYK